MVTEAQLHVQQFNTNYKRRSVVSKGRSLASLVIASVPSFAFIALCPLRQLRQLYPLRCVSCVRCVAWKPRFISFNRLERGFHPTHATQ